MEDVATLYRIIYIDVVHPSEIIKLNEIFLNFVNTF